LTPSEIEWLKREGREFQEQYSQIKATVLPVDDTGRPLGAQGKTEKTAAP
jgi:hypothetical protein